MMIPMKIHHGEKNLQMHHSRIRNRTRRRRHNYKRTTKVRKRPETDDNG